ncbi:MAG TPA: class I SAM-dependent methyltransferase [Solirubrobacter sp.]|nr:class I SAM-dependent methyltransferase [Solirubrobacter sp.]
MTGDPLTDDLRRLERHYGELVEEHGAAPEAAQWSDAETQRLRLRVLAEVGDLRSAKVLDFGCGAGALLAFLEEELDFGGEYVGYDLAQPAVELAARLHPNGRFERRDVLADGVPEDFDYILVSGVFNNRTSDGWGFMTRILGALWPHARQGLAFNAMSTYVDYRADHLWYADPLEVFTWCRRELTPALALRHDYQVKPGVIPFEFALFAYQRGLTPR